MSAVQAVLGATDAEMEKVRKKALQLGQDTIFSAQEVASGMEDLSKAGLGVDEIINGAADATVYLAAAAGNMKLDRAAEIAANAMRTFDLSAGDLLHVADSMAGAANVSTLEVEDLAVSMRYAGAVAKAAGVDIDEFNTTLAILGDRGIRGSTAGTSLRGILLSLSPSSAKAAAQMKELGIITEDGSNKFFDAAGNMKSMAEVAQVLQDATRNLSQEQKVEAFNTIFQRRAMASALILADQGAAGFDKYADAIGKVTAAEVASVKLDNLSGDIEILRGNLETLFIEQGSVFQEMLRGWVQALIGVLQWFTNLDKGTQKLIMQFLLWGGILAIVTGSSLLFVGQLLKMYRIFRDIQKAVKILTAANTALNASFLANPAGLVVIAVLALGAALFAAYKKIEPFRKAVDKAWQVLQGFWDTITGAAVGAWHALQDAWDGITGAFSAGVGLIKRNWDLLLPIFLGPIGVIIVVWRRFGDDLKNIASSAISAVVSFFTALPGRVVGALATVIAAVMSFFSELPGHAVSFASDMMGTLGQLLLEDIPQTFGFMIGFVIGAIVGFLADIIGKVIEWGPRLIKAFVDFLVQLPGKFVEGFTTILTKLASFAVDAVAKVVELGVKFISAYVEFWAKLPGRTAEFISDILSKLARFVIDMGAKGVELGSKFVLSVLDWVIRLPGMIGNTIEAVFRTLIGFFGRAFSTAGEFGLNIVSGIGDWIIDLPSIMGDILHKMIDIIKGLVRRAFNAVKEFAKGLWDGFKAGLGISSPSYIERAMTDIVNHVSKDIGLLGKQVKEIQALGNELATVDTSPNLSVVQTATGLRAPSAVATGFGAPAEVPVAGGGDHIEIYGADQKSALEISREIMFEKRVRVA